MQFLDKRSAAELIAKLTCKPVLEVFIKNWIDIEKDYGLDGISESLKAAPYLDYWSANSPSNLAQFFAEDGGFIVCDNEEEMWKLYYSTVGDDGPTKYNSYNGPAKVYVAAYSAEGECLTENT